MITVRTNRSQKVVDKKGEDHVVYLFFTKFNIGWWENVSSQAISHKQTSVHVLFILPSCSPPQCSTGRMTITTETQDAMFQVCFYVYTLLLIIYREPYTCTEQKQKQQQTRYVIQTILMITY